MRKILLVGIMIFCATFVNAQDEVKEVLIPGEDEKEQVDDDVNKYLNSKAGDAKIGDIIMIIDTTGRTQKPTKEISQTSPPPTNESIERSSSSSNATPSGSSSSSSARQSSSRKRSKRKKISLKRKRPNKIKRKRKLGNRAACPRF